MLTLASAFLIWQSIKLIGQIHELELSSWGALLFIAWVINMFVTGIFAFAGFAHPTQKLLPRSYYEIHFPDRLNRLYKVFRVAIFKKLLLATLWRNKQQRKNYFDGSRGGILSFSEQSMKSEFGHLIPLILLTTVSIYLIVVDQPVLGLFTMAINVIGNFYPVVLQRHHRMRIQRLGRRRVEVG